MFIDFFYHLKDAGIPVSPTSFLTLHQAMDSGLVTSVDDLYIAARTILIKSEKFFDLYDQIFAYVFNGVELPVGEDEALFDLLAEGLVQEWLKDPKQLAEALGQDQKKLAAMTPAELLRYFKERLKDQHERHDGGAKWIGTGGTSPVGHSGFHPGGLRIGGVSGNRSAIKVAGERRYRDYSTRAVLSRSSIGAALRQLRNLVPLGAKDRLNIDASIYRTMKNGGEIELIFERGIVDRLKIILAIDNGGWSMEPHVELVQTLFNYAKAQFKDLKTYFFHNTIYDLLWEDAARYRKPVAIREFVRLDPDTRLIIVGDASMAPYELMATDGSIYAIERSGKPSMEQLRFLAGNFHRTIWLNPIPQNHWSYTHTIKAIRTVFPMYELSLDGLEEGVGYLMGR